MRKCPECGATIDFQYACFGCGWRFTTHELGMEIQLAAATKRAEKAEAENARLRGIIAEKMLAETFPEVLAVALGAYREAWNRRVGDHPKIDKILEGVESLRDAIEHRHRPKGSMP